MKARTPIRPTHPRSVKTVQQQKEKKPEESKKVPNAGGSSNIKVVKPPTKRPEIFELQKPFPTSCQTFSDLVKVFNNGTNDLRHLLDFECELIYECKVCRSLFRSLSNFIQHKRAYCFERSRDFGKDLSNGEVVDKVVHLSENNPKGQLIASRKTMRKDIYELLKKVGNLTEDKAPEPLFTRDIKETDAAYLAFFQQEGKAPSEERSAVLGPDGFIVNSQRSAPINSQRAETDSKSSQASVPADKPSTTAEGQSHLEKPKSEASKPGKCLKCNETFDSPSDLSLHTRSCSQMRYYYSCPVCQKAVHSPYSVYRHLRKVHNKSLDQVQKLRSKIRKVIVKCDPKTARAINRPTSPVSKAKPSLTVPSLPIKRVHSPDRTGTPSKKIVEVRSYGKNPLPHGLSVSEFMRKQPLVVLTKTDLERFSSSMASISLPNSSASSPSTGESNPSASQPQSSASAAIPHTEASPSLPSPQPNPPKKPRVEKDLSWLKKGPSVPIVGGPLTRTARALYGSPKKNTVLQEPDRGKPTEDANDGDSKALKSAEEKPESAESDHEVSDTREASPSDNDTDDDELKDDGESLDGASAMNKSLSSSEDNVQSLTGSVRSFDSSPAKVDGEANDRMSTSGVETDLSPEGDRVTPSPTDDDSSDVDRLVHHFQTKSSPAPPKLSPCNRPVSADRSSDSGSSGSAEDSGVTSDERSCFVRDTKATATPLQLTVEEASKVNSAKQTSPLRKDPNRPAFVNREEAEDPAVGILVCPSSTAKAGYDEEDQTDSEDCQEEEADSTLRSHMMEIIFGSLPTSSFRGLSSSYDHDQSS